MCCSVTEEKEDEGEEKKLSSFQREKRERERERKKNEPNWKINKIIRCKATVTVHKHGYCSKFRYLQSFTWFDASVFCAMLCNFLYFLYFAMTDKIALN